MKIISIIKYLFTAAGLVLLVGTVYLYLDKQAFIKKAEVVQGDVVELVRERSNNSIMYAPVVSFITKEGSKIEITSSVSSNPPSYNVGETVEIMYNPKEPNKANINSFESLWLGVLVMGIFGIIFFLVGFLIILYGIKKQRKKQYLLDNGKRISTTFNEVQLNYNFEVNGRNPYQIKSQWFNIQTNKMYVFESENIWFDPTEFIKTDEIKVLIDPDNPKNYYMDISFLPVMDN
ncbi:DUF3592 domain-containing protein [Flavobacterium johnsoniae]|jgi:hypothetical protein|uniref:DUF3592 domain-containing protein n=1 Tax=Flavobacterium johnsoniae (strain ATCC 17061 / DSM 2064 / JCM 8514 / BCRC 14874 / CCUG 350202 / NBRC 14942 / NCIMB 11054 / UW101) TaxID=376686 RepID=A5FB62_FLAJ1|nr:DUF3592 domain-containing protein [Flavobacterium johnsoniae]ABQ07553.1 hypothetical protein Fjoh_4554 [Flavobacterium johnsoniae UW101]OXE99452.1 hypothetical protein B0A63_12830 [Flavobacterium johnsoniae UW101]WQG80609.1 DUF3592 domain-containing protein [Flavobacterium johnsoniae UW101]SHL09429.1 Protein of unknown function [Flavobacterium johnsoniae]